MSKIICISRTDSIGDVVLTLPLVGYLKKQYPDGRILFLGRNYTLPILKLSSAIDEVLLLDEMEGLSSKEIGQILKSKNITDFIHVFPNKRLAHAAKIAKIPNRIGTSHRLFHLNTCNRKVNFTRKRSDLHESQLNFKLLKGIGISFNPTLDQVSSFLNDIKQPESNVLEKLGIVKEYPVIILHPKSQGSAVEWGVPNFVELMNLLKEKKAQVLVSGTEKEAVFFRDEIPKASNILDVSGKLSLEEFIALISESDALVAASTGPLHIAGILNRAALGLFSPRKPIHPGRWKPIGQNTDYLVFNKDCEECKKGNACNCIQEIQPQKVYQKLTEMLKTTF